MPPTRSRVAYRRPIVEQLDNWPIALIVALALAAPVTARADGRPSDQYGCHYDGHLNQYHCHQGPLDGRKFKTREEGRKAFEEIQAKEQKRAAEASAAAQAIAGRASVADGDSLVIGGQRIQLFGIDSPEGRESCRGPDGAAFACGQDARQALMRMIATQPVTCQPKERDGSGRIVAVCTAGGVDIAGWLVAEGHARASRKISTDYVKQEEEAKKAARGLWRGGAKTPSGAAPRQP